MSKRIPMKASEELKDKVFAQDIYKKIVNIIAKIDEVRGERISNLGRSPTTEALLVCLSQIHKNVIAIGMILNSYINTCSQNELINEKNFIKLYCENSQYSTLSNLGFAPLNFLMVHGSHICFCFHVDQLFRCLFNFLENMTPTLSSEKKKEMKQDISKKIDFVLEKLLGVSQGAYFSGKLKAIFSIRNSYHNNGLDKKTSKLTSFSTLEFINWIEDIVEITKQISLSPAIKKTIIIDDAASLYSDCNLSGNL